MWLRTFLAGRAEPVRAAEAVAVGRQAGHTEPALRQAARAIGVRTIRRGGAGTTWSLADAADAQPDDGDELAEPRGDDGRSEVKRAHNEPTPSRSRRVPTGRPDAFGVYREHVNVVGPAEASHWDERAWRHSAT